MSSTIPAKRGASLVYQADEQPPAALTLGLGVQYAFLSLSALVLAPTIAYRAAGAEDSAVAFAVFASLLIAGAMTALHALPTSRFSAGYVLVTGPTAAAIAINTDALSAGGPALLGALVVASAIFQLAFSYRIAMFRKLLTPTVSGVILMLIPVTVLPIVFGQVTQVPPGHEPWSGPVAAFVTLGLIVFVSVKGPRRLRPWAPLVGIAGGAVVASNYGLYDVDRVLASPLIGAPSPVWHFGSLDPGPSFWALLPSFLLVSLSCSIRTMSSALAVQDVSWRTPRAPDLRAVQGAIGVDALANLLSGLSGTVLAGTRSTTAALTRVSRVASRRIGIVLGGTLVLLAFSPAVLALVLALPGAVLSAYLLVMLATLFVVGMKIVVADGLDQPRILVAGLSFWIGAGCQFGLLLPEVITTFADGAFASGIAAGGLTAIVLTVLLELTRGRRQTLEVALDLASLAELRSFVGKLARDHGASRATFESLEAVAEETLLTLLHDQSEAGARRRRLRVTAYRQRGETVLEFVANLGEGNIEDRISLLGDVTDVNPAERDISLRLLRHLASDVRHRQYHDVDFITVRVADAK